MKIRLVYLCLLFVLSACDHGALWRDPPYTVYWINSPPYKLGYDIGGGGIISKVNHVTAIGSDENYVVAQTLRSSDSEPEYYFIDRRNDSAYKEDAVNGPFSESTYNSLKKKHQFPEFEKRFYASIRLPQF